MINNIIIQSATLNHSASIAALEEMCFSHPWSERAVTEFLQNDLSHCFIATSENEPDIAIGYIGLYIVLDNADITNIAVHKDFRRRSIASSLISRVIDFCRDKGVSKIALEVRSENTAARNLYEKYGFCEVGIRKNYYKDPKDDAVLMDFVFENTENQ